MADNNTKAAGKKESFFSGVKKEWSKIIWLTKEDIIKQTSLVVVMSLIMGVIITVIDSAALQLINWILAL
jgi:preprotein translocase subunit SecE